MSGHRWGRWPDRDGSGGPGDADRAGQAVRAVVAVAARVLGVREVLLVVVLGVVVRAEPRDLGGDRAVARPARHRLEELTAALGGALLLVRGGVDGRAVLGA